MRLFKASLFTAIACLILSSCADRLSSDWTPQAIRAVNDIVGTYTLNSATFSEPVDLTGTGIKSNNVLVQIELYGWYGAQTRNDVSVLENNKILEPEVLGHQTQINFFVPSPRNGMDIPATGDETRCFVNMDEFQFHYKVDASGHIDYLFNQDFQNDSQSIKLQNIAVSCSSGVIEIKAFTSYFDRSLQYRVGGHLSLVYVKN